MADVLQRLIKQYLCLLLCTMNSNSALMTVIWVITRCRNMSLSQHATFIFGMPDLQTDRYWSNWEKKHDKTIYIQHYTVAHSCNSSSHGNTTICSSCMVVGIEVGVKDIKMFSGAREMQLSVPFALLSSYIIFHITANNNKY